MTSIFQGQLYRNFVKDQNQFRLESYDVNRFQRTVQQQTAQSQREKTLREGLEFHQAIMADLQTKLNEVTEKLNNLYRRYMENQVAFLKSNYAPTSTADAVAGLPRVDDPNFADTAGYPAGAAGILPHNDFDKIRNFSYNPYFGSKAIEQSDLNMIRTLYEEPGVTTENAYKENGAFWSTLSYLWGWDLDRINATYVTNDIITGQQDVQINVTALQPNKPQYPPLKTGDRFPLNWTGNVGNPGNAPAPYPGVNIGGLRPGGVDFSHAADTVNTTGDTSPTVVTANVITGNGSGTPPGGNPIEVSNAAGFLVNDSITVTKNGDTPVTTTITFIDDTTNPGGPHYIWTSSPAGSNNSSGIISKTTGSSASGANLNAVGKDSINMGWEFDDLPMALEVTGVEERPDGTTVPTGYKVVYDIPPTHPHYEALKALNGTEPMIIDAPTELRKDRIHNDGFDYTGFAFVPGSQTDSINFLAPGFKLSGAVTGGDTSLTPANILKHAQIEDEWPPPKLYASANVPGEQVNTSVIGIGTPGGPYTPGGGVSLSGGDPIRFPTTADLLKFTVNENVTLIRNSGSTYNMASTVQAIYVNTIPTDGASGDGDTNQISLAGPLESVQQNDYVTFDSAPPGVIYRVSTVTPGVGFNVVQTTPAAPAFPTGVVAGTTKITLWADAAATVPKFATEGLVVSPTAPVGNPPQIVKKADIQATNEPIISIPLTPSCDQYISITPNTRVSMRYRYVVSQNYGQLPYRSPGDDGLTPGVNLPNHQYTGYEWTSAGQEYNSPLGDNTFGGQEQYKFPLTSIPFSTLTNSLMNSGPDSNGTAPGGTPFRNDAALGSAPSVNTMANAAWVFGVNESVTAVLENDPDPTNKTLHLKVFFNGDLNNFHFEVQDIQIVTYDGILNNWSQGQYDTAGNTPIDYANGDVTVDQTSSPDDVINKYVPGVFQFTQFNDQYNVPHSLGDRNDILRSPWEYAMLNIDSESSLSGEMSLDLNSRRLNLDFDNPEATVAGWAEQNQNIGWVGAGDFVETAPVQTVTEFNTADDIHPDDDCADLDYTAMDSDPLSTVRDNTLQDEVLPGEASQDSTVLNANPGRTTNPPSDTSTTTPFYSLATPAATPTGYTFTPHNFLGNNDGNAGNDGENDITNTVDRVGARDGDFNYTITIPTNDANVLRNENNLRVNFGSIDDMDWAIKLQNMYMDVRTIPSYTTVPRYRVDAGGNIFDAFGKGYYDLRDLNNDGNADNARDQASVDRLYTVTGDLNNDMVNGQISNADRVYQSMQTAYNTGGSYETMVNSHDRLSMATSADAVNDDYNLFDYVPDLTLDTASKEGARNGESYVGSFPSNFYYYRELLDNSSTEGAAPPTGNHTPVGSGAALTLDNDNRPAINFDGAETNRTGVFNTDHTYVYNAEMPAFTNVALGFVEQDARLSNTQKTTTHAVWQGFPGLASPLSYAIGFDPARSSNVSNPTSALGDSDSAFALMLPSTSSITLDMGKIVNDSGYLVVNEFGATGPEGHAVPLPLFSRPAPFPNYDDTSVTNSTYTFNAYGISTVTRTGSKYMNFNDAVLDAIDGNDDGAYATGSAAGNMTLLTTKGARFSTGNTGAVGDDPTTWPNGVLLHVDDASKFDLNYPRNIVTLGTDTTTRYRIMYADPTTVPESIFLVRDNGSALTTTLPGSTTTAGFVQADLQVREVTGSYTVSVRDAAGNLSADGQFVRIDYNDSGTGREGKLESVGLSSAVDRVGRIPGNDPRTAATETQAIAPEIFDSPKGYVQPDAQVDLKIVSQDKDGNMKARKLKTIKVQVASGEQIVPTDLIQTYTTYNDTRTDDGDGVRPFGLTGGANENWPIAVYDGDVQINPLVTNDLNFMTGYYQGIRAGSSTTSINVMDAADFKVGHKVTINGEQRTIQSIPTAGAPGVIVLDKPLSTAPVLGDKVTLGDGTGTHDLKLFLNRNFAMSMGAGLKVTLEYDEYEYTGYPPTIDKSNPTAVSEEIGFGDPKPKETLDIDPTNTGDGITPIAVLGSTTNYAIGDVINLNGQTFRLRAKTASTISLGRFDDTNIPPAAMAYGNGGAANAPKSGSVSHQDYEDFLEVGEGRSGGSQFNEFTQELKRIIDNPEYRELFRHDLFKNVFITAAINDPFNDLIASKITLTWDRIRRQAEITQTSFTAYFKKSGT